MPKGYQMRRWLLASAIKVGWVAAAYAVAPGLVAYAEYLYGQVHQGGINLLGIGTTAEHNDVHSQSFIIGTRIQW
jgi:hypothetical protein